jgi:hypothetical protein
MAGAGVTVPPSNRSDLSRTVIVQLPLYRSNQALDIFKKTLDIWKVMKYAGVDECAGASESGGWTKAA